ncbi:NPCBM/NEW2 domain-containing protein [bacterium]|nr:NPCBM/NEW2 domain-containing protein [bacterium]
MALDPADIPADAPADAVMASAAEVQAVAVWAAGAFAGIRAPAAAPRVGVELRHQDHSVLRFGQSILQAPIQIGSRTFSRGLGTHANSEIVVTVPAGARTFRAVVGLDNNPDTRKGKGSVQFIVECGGKEAVRTGTLRCGDEPAPVNVPIPEGARQIILKVDATPDGTGWDHADWADAQVVLADGSALWLDDQPQAPLLSRPEPPLSFVYDGNPSAKFLPTWARTVETKDSQAAIERRVHWSDPKTRLRLTAVVTTYKRYPAVDWVLHFENQGEDDTPILQDIQALDVSLATGKGQAALHGIAGDDCSEGSFLPFEKPLPEGASHRMAPNGGRSSNGAFPFFNYAFKGQGILTAIGWSGQWAASLERAPTGATRPRAGMERTRLRLRPGESIRSPRILLLAWQGDRQAAHNRFRRLLLHHYAPQDDGRPMAMPVFWQGYDRYRTHPRWGSEAGQLHAAQAAHDAGADYLWLDAAWFPGDFPNGVGNWFCKPKEFPRGLEPVSDACHRMGMKFILWFEPERVAAGSQIARERPEFVFGGAKGGLFKLNDPAARRWLTDLLLERMAAYGVDWYRNDFNIDPLPFWRANDAPDRQGMTEIRYVEGHYAMWDEFRARRPGLHIDNCASGGRRIDLETVMRAVPNWQSDTACVPGRADWDQAQHHGLSLYIPFHQSCGWAPDAYTFRSAAGAGAITQFAFLDEGYSLAEARAAIAEAKANQRYWYGDFYPLTPCTTAADQILAYQFHRADLDAGIVLGFRREACNVFGLNVDLGGIDPEGAYIVEAIDEARKSTVRTLSGREMATDFQLVIPTRRSSVVVRYRPAKPRRRDR